MLLHPGSFTSGPFESNFSRSGYYCSSQTHVDDDGCSRRRMFALLQPLPYQGMCANSLKQMETRRGRNEERGKVQPILCSTNDAGFGRWIVFPASWECKPQQGREKLGSRQRPDQRCPPMLTSACRLHLSKWIMLLFAVLVESWTAQDETDSFCISRQM